MAYHLNVLFLIPLPQDRHPVAALEDCPVTLQYQITCPPWNVKGLSI